MKKTKIKHQSVVKPGKKSEAKASPVDDEVDYSDEENFKDLMNRACNTKDTDLFKKHLAAGRVLFCPGCACDWNALARLSDVARIFVFCIDGHKKTRADALSLDNCPEPLRGLFSDASMGELDTHTPHRPHLPNFGGLGGRCVCVNRNIEMKGQVVLKRKLMAVLMNADPVTVYDKLFVQPGVAPSYVSLLHAGWQGAMKNLLLQAGPAAPKSLIAEWPGGYGPWNWRWRHLRSWSKATVFRRRTDPAHPAIQLKQSREMTFEALPLIPQHLNHADGVVVTLEQYLENWWLGARLRIFIDTTNEEAVADIKEYDRRVEALPLRGRPLAEAADALARACGASIHHVHCNFLGLEDEAEAVWKGWRDAFGSIRLVLHGTSSDWESVVLPCADLE